MSEPQRILHVSAPHPDLTEGEKQRSAYDLFLASRTAGLDVDFLAACRPDQAPALFKPGAVVTGFDSRPHEHLLLADSIEDVWHRNLNHRALTWFAEFVRELRPHVVHFHDIETFGLDPLLVVRRTLPEARLVLTLHDFRAICRADGQMIRRIDATLCDRASSYRCHQCFPDTAPEMFHLREDWVKHALSVIDAFVAPTEFVRRRYLAWGLPTEKLYLVPNAPPNCAMSPDRTAIHDTCPAEPTNRFGIFGAPLEEASLRLLLDALEIYEATFADPIVLEVNGIGLRDAMQDRCVPFAGRARIRLREAGGCPVTELPARMARVDWVVLPSLRWEAFSRLVSMAYIAGRPPVCANIGALGERVWHNRDGLLFEAGDPSNLAVTLHRCTTEPGLYARLVAGSPGVPDAAAVVQAHCAVYRG